MVVIADNKRRVVLPKTAKPGDVFECLPKGAGYVLEKLQPPPKAKPPVARRRLPRGTLARVNLDEPAFLPLSDGRPD